jgi:hypothetical protein
MPEALEQLVQSLLWEGYSLYPYTPTATKNATPTPFGIVYPPAYAAECEGAFDRARLDCLAVGGSAFRATIRWLDAAGAERRLELGPIRPGERASQALAQARFTLRADGEPGVVRCCVHNTAEVPSGLDRGAALRRSLLSLHIVVRVQDGRFVSPLDADLRSVNTYPVLASPADDVVLGASIVLPDHPQIAPESSGSMFDGTEIEEALRLHVQVLSDGELEEIAGGDPAVREMVERARVTAPEDLLALHGRLTLRDPREGEPEATVGEVTFRRGDMVVLHPPASADLQARIVAGRRATLERILIDYDGRVHLGVTIDDDPGQELMRETGRFLYFFADEVEVVK